MKHTFATLLLTSVFLFQACNADNTATSKENKKDSSTAHAAKDSVPDMTGKPVADAATILARKEVPILCYHHIRPLRFPGKASSGYEVTPESFRSQMKMLSDSGYHSVLPDQLYNYLAYGTPLPEKPFMITYDDTDEEQFTIGKSEMDKYGFKGVYFIMTISIGRPNYMSKDQIKQLAQEGHAIESHTWRHDRVDKYLTTPHIDKGTNKMVENDWDLQLGEQRKKLEAISGKPIHYFAYPFGIWKPSAFPELKKRDFKLAFQLSTKRDSTEPLYTVRRIIIDPSWSSAGLLRVMRSSFH
ncbi:MAG: polysaccharide deacetylase family protein [Flaviaesturariibacter sp.]|nr:polysaccharide deacetylase family protein [Flaviaesturariibacter sp.]